MIRGFALTIGVLAALAPAIGARPDQPRPGQVGVADFCGCLCRMPQGSARARQRQKHRHRGGISARALYDQSGSGRVAGGIRDRRARQCCAAGAGQEAAGGTRRGVGRGAQAGQTSRPEAAQSGGGPDCQRQTAGGGRAKAERASEPEFDTEPREPDRAARARRARKQASNGDAQPPQRACDFGAGHFGAGARTCGARPCPGCCRAARGRAPRGRARKRRRRLQRPRRMSHPHRASPASRCRATTFLTD